jgi:hypothetical protein
MAQSVEAVVAPPNTIIVRLIPGGDCLEWSPLGGLEQVENYLVLAVNVDEEKGRFIYDWPSIPLEIGGQYTQAINEAVAHLPRETTRQVSDMAIVGDSELEELRARGVDVIVQFPEE